MPEIMAVPLSRYAQRITYQECAFFGVTHPDNVQYACREIWTQPQRDAAYQALMLAQEQIERVVNYFLTPKWTAEERHGLIRRGSHLVTLFQTYKGHLITPGVVSDTLLGTVAVDYDDDPAIITIETTCTDVRVFHPGTDDEIEIASKTLLDGIMTIEIPWCRLMDRQYWYQDGPFMYDDVLSWATPTVDVRCITNDTSTQATLYARANGCAENVYDACMYLENPRYGLVKVIGPDCIDYNSVDLNYYSGRTRINRAMEDAIIRLAHAGMPTEPCGCAVTQRLWERDREMPKYFLSRERINCPFGMTEGAWQAWVYANGHKLVRGAVWA